MLRNAIEAALLFSYCYIPICTPNKTKTISYVPNTRYGEYAKWENWNWDSGIKDSIYCLLGAKPLLGIKPTCQDEIQLIRDRANFSTSLMQRQIKTFHEFLEMTQVDREALYNRIKWAAEKAETKEILTMAAKYLRHIREVYFQKFTKTI